MNIVSTFQERFCELIGSDSYTSVGDRIGMSKQTISAYAKGVRNAKKPTINAIATNYGVDPLWLIGYDIPRVRKSPLGIVADDNGLHGASALIKDATAPKPHPLVEIYDTLNEEGKEKLLDYADDLAQSGKYKK